MELIKIELDKYTSMQERLKLLLTHLALWMTTLKPVHAEFNVGFIRILDRKTANAEVERHQSYLIRSGLGRPASLVRTSLDKKVTKNGEKIVARQDILESDDQYLTSTPDFKKLKIDFYKPTDDDFVSSFEKTAANRTMVSYQDFELAKEQMAMRRTEQVNCYQTRYSQKKR